MINYIKKSIIAGLSIIIICTGLGWNRVSAEEYIPVKRLVKNIVTENHAYYDMYPGGKLYRMDLDWSNKEYIDTLISRIHIKDGWIYYIRKGSKINSIMRIKDDGNDKDLIISLEGVYQFHIVDDKIYYQDIYGFLYRCDLNGENNEKVYDKEVFGLRTKDLGKESRFIVFKAYDEVSQRLQAYRMSISGKKELKSIRELVGSEEVYNQLAFKGELVLSYCDNEAITYWNRGEKKYYFDSGKIEEVKNLEEDYYSDKSSNSELYSKVRVNMDNSGSGDFYYQRGYMINIGLNSDYILEKFFEGIYPDGKECLVEVIWDEGEVDYSKKGIYKVTGKSDYRDTEFEFQIEIGDIDSMDQLIDAVRDGKKEFFFSNEFVKECYLSAKRVLEEIITDDMEVLEKELRIIDFIAEEKIELYAINSTPDYLESNEERKLKEAILLLNMAGIESYVKSDFEKENHWIVINLDGEFYNVFLNVEREEYGNLEYTHSINIPDSARDITREVDDKFECISDSYKEFQLSEGLREKFMEREAVYEDDHYKYIKWGTLWKIHKDNGMVSKVFDNVRKINTNEKVISYMLNEGKGTEIKTLNRRDMSIKTLIKDKREIKSICSNGKEIFLNYKTLDGYDIENNIYKLSIDSGELKRISNGRASEMKCYDKWLYYSDKEHNNMLYKERVDGSYEEQISTGAVKNLILNQKRFMYDQSAGIQYHTHNKAYREFGENIFTGHREKDKFAIYKERLYFIDVNNNDLYYYKVQEDEIEKVCDYKVNRIKAFGEKIYVEMINKDIWEYTPKTDKWENTELKNIGFYYVDDDKIYYKSRDEDDTSLYIWDNIKRVKEKISSIDFDEFKTTKEFIFIKKDDNLYRINKKTGETLHVSDMCKSFDVWDDKVFFLKSEEERGKVIPEWSSHRCGLYELDKNNNKIKISKREIRDRVIMVNNGQAFYFSMENEFVKNIVHKDYEEIELGKTPTTVYSADIMGDYLLIDNSLSTNKKSILFNIKDGKVSSIKSEYGDFLILGEKGVYVIKKPYELDIKNENL